MTKQTIALSAVLAAYMGQTMMAEAATAEGEQAAAPAIPAGSKEFSFNFRTEKIRGEDGTVLADGKKRPTVKVVLPVPSRAELVEFIAAGGKEAEFIDDVIYEAIKAAGRAQINDAIEANADVVITTDLLKLNELTFTAIANTAPESRAKPEIPEEMYTTFYEDYKKVQVDAGKELGRVQKHIALFKAQFRTCKFDKPALQVLKDNLNIWAAKTDAMEDNAEVFGHLMSKVEKYLKAEEKNLVGAL